MRVRHSTDTVAGLALVLATLISLLVSGLATSAAETSPEYQVKAVFLFNFAQFVEWPPQSYEDPAAPFVIGVLGTDPFGPALEGAVRGETLNGRSFVIERYRNVAEIRHCQILFISRSEAAHIGEIGAALAGHSILTVSDIEDPTQRGVMIRFVAENNRIRLRINADAAKAAGLSISSKLLRPAELVTSAG
jgi:YfiR/HmsC-like